MLNKNSTIVYNYFTRYLKSVYRCFRPIPHSLNAIQKVNRVNDLQELSLILQRSKHYGFRNIITGDQSWFNFYIVSDGAWIEKDDDPPEMIKDHISSEKIMITIFWGIIVFFIVDILPAGQSYNSLYFTENILKCLFGIKESIWKERVNKKKTVDTY